jgi:hypothetical protein
MSNELMVGMIAAVGLAATAILIARFMILDSPTSAILQRIGQVVHEADPDLRARVSLQELQRPAGSVQRADDEEVGR